MKTLRTLLREGDPVDREPSPAPEDVERMRRVVLASVESARSPDWTLRVAIAAAVSLLAGAGMWVGPSTILRRPAPQQIEGRDRAGAPAGANGVRRQVHFATPGGTRIIWVFDSNFNVR